MSGRVLNPEWKDGFNTGASLANEAIKDLLGAAVWDNSRREWRIADESILAVKAKLQQGYDKNMRIGSPQGLKYYFKALFKD